MNKIYVLTLIAIITALIMACDSNIAGNSNPILIERDDKIFIEDQTGKQWDITHAVQKYDFRPGSFEHGLGPFAITPINNPEMLVSGNAGYPDVQDERLVIGTTINNDTRAYSLSVLGRHEIVNEQFDDTYVAVAY